MPPFQKAECCTTLICTSFTQVVGDRSDADLVEKDIGASIRSCGVGSVFIDLGAGLTRDSSFGRADVPGEQTPHALLVAAFLILVAGSVIFDALRFGFLSGGNKSGVHRSGRSDRVRERKRYEECC